MIEKLIRSIHISDHTDRIRHQDLKANRPPKETTIGRMATDTRERERERERERGGERDRERERGRERES